ncbi:MAG: nucleotidyltransferase domain-containing protein [Defluviitaleaceae bacterium]|nr:nucleotidyltransferase domain-containing protein [Defluviitaleaceae bacterium]
MLEFMEIVKYPDLDLETLHNFLCYRCKNISNIVKIGVIGSYARNTQTAKSDIDLTVDVVGHYSDIDETLIDLADALEDNFGKEVDIVKWKDVLYYSSHEPSELYWYWKEGYQQMKEQVKWIYERNDAL